MEICFHHIIGDSPDLVTEETVTDAEKQVEEIIRRCISDLPRAKEEEGIVGLLDRAAQRKIKLPRALPLPVVKKAKTKWEKFAATKGIKKDKKRNRLVYDEVDHDYKLRYGGRSAKKAAEDRDFIVEHRSAKDAYTDPFAERAQLKALSKSKQKLQEIKNKVHQAGYRLSARPTVSKKKASRR